MLEINGVGIKTMAGFIAEVGDITRFDDPDQIKVFPILKPKLAITYERWSGYAML